MKDLWHFIVKGRLGGRGRRTGMSSGEKTVIILNLCHCSRGTLAYTDSKHTCSVY